MDPTRATGSNGNRTPLRPSHVRTGSMPVLDATASRALRAGLVALPGGTFAMGSEDADVNRGDAEGPVREVEVGAFLIAPTTVTNAGFAEFVDATGYRTQAEEFGWSYVFHLFVRREPEPVVLGTAGTPWWVAVKNADWRRPEGPGLNLSGREDHPVVHVSSVDALAYCAWSGTRLPAETEWEYAARGGLDRKRFPCGDELTPGGRHSCNIWRGTFPDINTAEDGFVGTAPAASFEPNGYGLFNTAGNVWEWTPPLARRSQRPVGDQGRLLPVPRLLLQPLPRRCPDLEHRRLLLRQHRLPGRGRPVRAGDQGPAGAER